jgi:tetratricopeptide (TPR) repeat protein
VRRELATAQFIEGHYEDAIANLRQILAADPKYFGSANLLARALTQAGRPAEAITFFESRPDYRAWERWLMPAYIKLGREQDVKRLFDADAQRDDTPHRQAIIYAALGDKDKTFDGLSRAIDTMANRVAFMLQCPDFSLLRGDPRFAALRRRLKLE